MIKPTGRKERTTFKSFEAKPSAIRTKSKKRFTNKLKSKKMKRALLKIGSIVTVLVIAGMVVVGCQKEEDEPLDEAILNSSELEEYIIAGAEFQQSLANFSEQLNKIDFSTIEIAFDEEGREIRYLPTSVTSINIEGKVRAFNEKKETLRKKYPQLSSLKEDERNKYFQHCAENSIHVNSRLLEFGFYDNKIRLKNAYEAYNFAKNQTASLYASLSSHISDPDNAELLILKFSDGSYIVLLFDNATGTDIWFDSSIFSKGAATGKLFLGGDMSTSITEIGHTHAGSGNDCAESDKDKETKNNNYFSGTGVSFSIYCNGAFKPF